MTGLTDDTKVKMFALRSLEEMMEKAKQVEEKNVIIDMKYGFQPPRPNLRNLTTHGA